ncbi:hypothetical protein Tco_1426176 [Tanacetum coccineum]
MANTNMPLFRELAHAADSHDIRDQLLVLFRREVVKIRDGYINELEMRDSCDEVVEAIKIMRRMQLDDMEKASRLLLMVREAQNIRTKCYVKGKKKMVPVRTGYWGFELLSTFGSFDSS